MGSNVSLCLRNPSTLSAADLPLLSRSQQLRHLHAYRAQFALIDSHASWSRRSDLMTRVGLSTRYRDRHPIPGHIASFSRSIGHDNRVCAVRHVCLHAIITRKWKYCTIRALSLSTRAQRIILCCNSAPPSFCTYERSVAQPMNWSLFSDSVPVRQGEFSESSGDFPIFLVMRRDQTTRAHDSSYLSAPPSSRTCSRI